MESAPSEADRPKRRISPTLLVLGIAGATMLLYFTPMYFVGKRYQDRREFLRNYKIPNDFDSFASYCVDYAAGSSEANDIIFIGDSSCRCDLQTLQFQDQTGLKAYNLGSMGLLGMEGYHLILRTYLQHHPRPRAVGLCMLPSAVGLPLSQFTPPYASDVRPRFLWCFGSGDAASRPPDGSFLDISRQGIRSIYGSMVGGFDHFASQPNPMFGNNSYQSLKESVIQGRGHWLVPKQMPIPRRKDLSRSDPFTISGEFEQGLASIIRTCQEYEVLLLIRLTPHSGEAPEESPTLRAWADGLEARCPSVKVIRPELLRYDAEYFADPNHCNSRGVERFTGDFAEAVKRVLPARSGATTGQDPAERPHLALDRRAIDERRSGRVRGAIPATGSALLPGG